MEIEAFLWFGAIVLVAFLFYNAHRWWNLKEKKEGFSITSRH